MPDFTAEDFVRLVTLDVPATVGALAFSPDGSLLAVAAGDKVHIYRVPQQARTPQNQPPIPSAAPTAI